MTAPPRGRVAERLCIVDNGTRDVLGLANVTNLLNPLRKEQCYGVIAQSIVHCRQRAHNLLNPWDSIPGVIWDLADKAAPLWRVTSRVCPPQGFQSLQDLAD